MVSPYASQYINKDYFEKFGFKPPSEYTDFYDMCATIRKHGMKPLSSGLKDKEGLASSAMAIMQASYFRTVSPAPMAVSARKITETTNDFPDRTVSSVCNSIVYGCAAWTGIDNSIPPIIVMHSSIFKRQAIFLPVILCNTTKIVLSPLCCNCRFSLRIKREKIASCKVWCRNRCGT